MTTVSPQRPWLVTGAAGFLGSHVVEQLLGRRIPVVALDSLHWGNLGYLSPFVDHPLFTLVVADIREAKALRGVFESFRPANVVHLAALHYIPAAVADPPLAVGINVLGTQAVLSASTASGVERFWFASTGDVYAPADEAHHEDDRKEPFNIYGLSKFQGEQLVALAAQSQPAMRFVVGRLFNLYGARETNPHILPEILKQLRDRPGEPLRLGSLWPRRDLVPVTEAARAIIETTLQAPEGVTTLNIATGEARSMQEVIDLIGDLRGQPVPVETDPERVRPVERAHLQADVSRLKALIGWTPHADLRRGLADLLTEEGLLDPAATPGSSTR
ncbi:MAG: NAD(P)-dependent oxidoreductase [Isosphaeraceae bacterium]